LKYKTNNVATTALSWIRETTLSIQSEMNIFVPKSERQSKSDRICTPPELGPASPRAPNDNYSHPMVEFDKVA
jgi:hypothetical protein